MKARLVLLALAALALGGCKRAPVAIRFGEICYPPAFDEASGCVYPAECETNVADGVVDFDPGIQGYLSMPLQIYNLMEPNDDSSTAGINTNDAIITEFRMSYSGEGVSGSAVSVQTVPVPASGVAAPLVHLIPFDQTENLVLEGDADSMVIGVRASGHLVSGTNFTTDSFPVPVSFGSGWVACPTTQTLVGVCPYTRTDGLVGQTSGSPLCEDVEETTAAMAAGSDQQLPP